LPKIFFVPPTTLSTTPLILLPSEGVGAAATDPARSPAQRIRIAETIMPTEDGKIVYGFLKHTERMRRIEKIDIEHWSTDNEGREIRKNDGASKKSVADRRTTSPRAYVHHERDIDICHVGVLMNTSRTGADSGTEPQDGRFERGAPCSYLPPSCHRCKLLFR
jgi:hypothetical protein